jgi:hypothetical protein
VCVSSRTCAWTCTPDSWLHAWRIAQTYFRAPRDSRVLGLLGAARRFTEYLHVCSQTYTRVMMCMRRFIVMAWLNHRVGKVGSVPVIQRVTALSVSANIADAETDVQKSFLAYSSTPSRNERETTKVFHVRIAQFSFIPSNRLHLLNGWITTHPSVYDSKDSSSKDGPNGRRS